MFWKLTCAGVMFAALNANAATITITNGYDEPGAASGKTEIIDFAPQNTAFNLLGSLDLDGALQKNGNQDFVFGLYKNNTLIKGLADFTAASGDVYRFNFSNLASGTYSLRFNINGGGNYSFNANLTPFSSVVTPVPEPESMALMLVGLGAIVARRFKKA
ncbi:PEP-CTERM sorting domain-containing protein [Methylophilus glucosoxydans]|uniref:PEP-CTERM sorting domain-containing protein n=1 Tax=Methylophilus glucosoxydans TaxID=752553 RepID=A0ABW3GMM1_9PROT